MPQFLHLIYKDSLTYCVKWICYRCNVPGETSKCFSTDCNCHDFYKHLTLTLLARSGNVLIDY